MGLTRYKLKREIYGILPYDFKWDVYGKKRIKLVLDTILNKIVEGVVTDGFVTIKGLGRFYMLTRKHGKRVMKFTPTRVIRRSLDDVES